MTKTVEMEVAMLKEHENKMIELYIEQERMLSLLYKKISICFPEKRIFWEGISRNETKHAGMIVALYNYVKNGDAIFVESKTRTYTLNSFIDYIKSIVQRLEENKLDSIQAISISIDLENSLIEKNVFNSFQGDADAAKLVLNRLKIETIEHRSRLANMRAKLTYAPILADKIEAVA